MRRAILHIGMPRTGSTTLQHVLARLRDPLRTAGILYPDLTPLSARHASHINHQHLGETLDGRRPRKEREELLAGLEQALAESGCETVLLSYESFIHNRKRKQIPKLLGPLFARHGFAMESLVVVKPQSEYLNSTYTHRMQFMRERRDFARFARWYERDVRFAYDRLIAPWLAACDGRVRAVAVRDRRSAEPLVARMLAALDLTATVAPLLTPDDLSRIDNPSPGPVAVEVSRRLTRLRVPGRLKLAPREMMRFIEGMARALGHDQQGFRGVTPALRARMESRYGAGNARFAGTVWGAAWDDIVAPEPPQAINDLVLRTLDPAAEQAVRDIMRESCIAFGIANPA